LDAKQGIHDLLSSLTSSPSKPTVVRDPQNIKRLNKHVIEDSLHLYPTSHETNRDERQPTVQYQVKTIDQEVT